MTPHLAASTLGGYEYKFLTPPEDWLICNICHHPSREPYLSVCCGYTFCKSCLDGIKKSNTSTNACPMCLNEKFGTFCNKQADRAVRNLHVSCTNEERGCKWEGEVNNITRHLEDSDGCQFQDVKCPNHCRDVLQRQQLAEHVENYCVQRKVSCKYCHFTEECRIVEVWHMEKCPKFPLPCPNNCEVPKILREDIGKHREICRLEVVTCSNNCGVTLQRKYLVTHNKTKCPLQTIRCQHCQIAGKRLFIEGKHKEKCPKFPLPCPNKCDAPRISREDINKHRAICPLEAVPCLNNCGITLQRQDVAGHVKTDCPLQDVKCQYCNAPGERQLIEGNHMKLCRMHPMPCPNSCEVGSVPRNHLEDHRKVCPLEPIQCEYYVVGCKKKIARKGQKKHNTDNIEEHLSLIALQVTSTKLTMIKNRAEAVNSGEELCSKIAQTDSDLAASKEQLTSTQHTTEKNVAGITKELEKMKKKLATKEELGTFQLEVNAFKDDLSLKVKQGKQESKEAIEVNNKDLSMRLQQTQGELNQTKGELYSTNERLKASQNDLQNTEQNFLQKFDACNQKLTVLQQQLIATQKALSCTQTELDNTKDMLRMTQQTAQTTKDELHSTQTELANTKDVLKATQQTALTMKDELRSTQTELANTNDALKATQQSTQKTKWNSHM